MSHRRYKITDDGKKNCTKCLLPKPIDEFGKRRYASKKTNKVKISPIAKCMECVREDSKKHYIENKNYYKSKTIKWQSENREKIKSCNRNNAKKIIKRLSDGYIINSIIKRTNISYDEVSKMSELIEAKRLIIKTKRLCRTLQN